MKIIYAGLKYTNLNPNFGLSFEHRNFYESLRQLPNVEVIYFPYEEILKERRKQWNRKVLEAVRREKPDIFFAFMFTDELDFEVLDEIKKYTISIAWFSDDHWRFDNYSKYYAPHFSRVITTYSKAVQWYREAGIQNIIRSQWGVDTDLYKSVKWTGLENPPDVSFVGSWSRPRARIIEKLRKAGINAGVYGNGWGSGRVSQEKMVEIFSNSKINLALNPAPGFFNANSLGRLLFKRSMDRIVPDFHFINNFKSWACRNIPQIKARHFEIPACRGFMMTSAADDLDEYFKIGEEIVVYKDTPDLIEKINYYLEYNKERQKIAQAGYQRIIKGHSYKKRFSEIFQKTKGF